MTGTRISFLIAVLLLAGCSSGDSISNPIAAHRNLKRGPYVQLGTTDSVIVVWQTFGESETILEYGFSENTMTLVEPGDVGTRHSVTLSGLQPNSRYFYRVSDGERTLSRILEFHTNPESEDASFSFLVFGDSGSPGPGLASVATLVNASTASLALHTGDLVYLEGSEELYDSSFFYPFAQFLASNVMYPSLGNHDLQTDDGAPYLNNFFLPSNNPQETERYYSFDYANAHFVALDTNLPTAPGSAQRAWLEQDLAATTKQWKFVYFHHPPYSAGFQTANGAQSALAHTGIRRNLVPLFERYGVDIVFAG
ncbi:MAG TPA: metallophosphoesterase family protein, partial [Gammaproteobacteria bacterium]